MLRPGKQSFRASVRQAWTASASFVWRLGLDAQPNKYWNDKGIRAPTFEEKKARRRRIGGGRQVAVPPVMDVAAVQGQFDK